MRTLELRLEDVGYEARLGETRCRYNKGTGEDARLQAALEFFDRALVAGMAGVLDPAPHSGADPARAIFRHAAALALLRFGVRVVGLESAEPGEKGEEGHGSLPW